MNHRSIWCLVFVAAFAVQEGHACLARPFRCFTRVTPFYRCTHYSPCGAPRHQHEGTPAPLPPTDLGAEHAEIKEAALGHIKKMALKSHPNSKVIVSLIAYPSAIDELRPFLGGNSWDDILRSLPPKWNGKMPDRWIRHGTKYVYNKHAYRQLLSRACIENFIANNTSSNSRSNNQAPPGTPPNIISATRDSIVVSMSYPGIDSDGVAVVFVQHVQSELAGGQTFLILKRDRNSWTVVDEFGNATY